MTSMKCKKSFCVACKDYTEYELHQRDAILKVRGVTFMYTDTTAVCTCCNLPMYVPEVNDLNVETKEKAYTAATTRIGVSQKCTSKSKPSSDDYR